MSIDDNIIDKMSVIGIENLKKHYREVEKAYDLAKNDDTWTEEKYKEILKSHPLSEKNRDMMILYESIINLMNELIHNRELFDDMGMVDLELLIRHFYIINQFKTFMNRHLFKDAKEKSSDE